MSPAHPLDGWVNRDDENGANGAEFSAGQSSHRCGSAPVTAPWRWRAVTGGPQRSGMNPAVKGETSRLAPQ